MIFTDITTNEKNQIFNKISPEPGMLYGMKTRITDKLITGWLAEWEVHQI
jgi:hypothetical protein